jgi:Flp pilus assembly pilin Flp
VIERVKKYERGQAMPEYVVVTTLGVIVLIWGSSGDPSPISRLLAAIKSFYQAFSYAISVST